MSESKSEVRRMTQLAKTILLGLTDENDAMKYGKLGAARWAVNLAHCFWCEGLSREILDIIEVLVLQGLPNQTHDAIVEFFIEQAGEVVLEAENYIPERSEEK